MKTFVTITQQMLDGELTINEAAEEILQIPPAVPHYDIDGVSYDGEQDNTTSAMKLLAVDKNTGKTDYQVMKRIYDLIDAVIVKEQETK